MVDRIVSWDVEVLYVDGPNDETRFKLIEDVDRRNVSQAVEKYVAMVVGPDFTLLEVRLTPTKWEMP